MSDTHAHSHAPTYYVIFALLIVLVIATVGASMIHLGMFALPVALTIASCKALLIILYFMHVKDEAPLVRVFAFCGFLWLGLLFVFMGADYLTRLQNRPVDMTPRGSVENAPIDPPQH